MEIVSEGVSEEQLIRLGYYDDVVDAVLGYYLPLDPQFAYEDFLADSRLMVYLGSQYQSILLALNSRIVD